jgi:RNA polymerase sigma factor (sigma-70 family)
VRLRLHDLFAAHPARGPVKPLETIAKDAARSYGAMFPQLRHEDLLAVARETAWLAVREYDAAQCPNFPAYLTLRVKWAILHFVEKELPAVMRVFGGALRAAVRHGASLSPSALGTRDPEEELRDPEEELQAACDAHAAAFAGRLYADLGSAEGEDGLHARLDNARFLAIVDRTLAKMPEIDRLVWERRYRDEETHQAIATAFGFSVGTAKRRAAEAMSAIRCALRETGAPVPS